MKELAELCLPLLVVMLPVISIEAAIKGGKRAARWYNKRKPQPRQTFPLARCR